MSAFFDSTQRVNGVLVENVHYKVFTGPDNRKWKVINFDNKDICPREGVVEVQAIGKKSQHENKMKFNFVYDRDNDVYIGDPDGYHDKTKDMKFKRFQIGDSEALNLAMFHDAKKAVIIRNGYQTLGSPYFTKAAIKPKYRIYDREREAEKATITRKIRRKATEIAEGLFGKDLYDIGLNIGLNVENMSLIVLSNEVYLFAEKNPEQFMNLWDSPTRFENTVMNRARAVGVINHDHVNGFTYANLPLGSTEQMVIVHLKDNPQLCQTINMFSEEKERASKRAMEALSIEKAPVSLTDEKDFEIARHKAELDELKKKYTALANTQLNNLAEKQTKDYLSKTDPELLSLREEAVNAGVSKQGMHFLTKEKLRAKIAEKKATKDN